MTPIDWFGIVAPLTTDRQLDDPELWLDASMQGAAELKRRVAEIMRKQKDPVRDDLRVALNAAIMDLSTDIAGIKRREDSRSAERQRQLEAMRDEIREIQQRTDSGLAARVATLEAKLNRLGVALGRDD